MSYGWLPPLTGTVTQGTTAAVLNIPLPGIGSAADIFKFEVFDETQFGLASANTDMLMATWYRDMAPGSAFVYNRTSGSAAAFTSNMVTTNGFTIVDPTGPSLQAAKTGTAITNANPAVVTINAHGYSPGDVVLITKTTGMLQIAGMYFTVGTVATNTFQLVDLDASGFAAAATAVTAQKLNYLPYYSPRRLGITNIGTASASGVSGTGTSTIVTMSQASNFTVGQAVRIYVPNAFITSGANPFSTTGPTGKSNGVAQFITATISAINTADASGITNTMTVNINSTGTTFAFPTSATAATGIQMPFVEPVGMAATAVIPGSSVNPANSLDDRTMNTASLVMQLGSSVYGVAGDTLRWIAYRGYVLS